MSKNRTTPGLLALSLLLLTLAATPPTATAATVRILEITQDTAKPLVPFQAFDGNPPKVYDINGDRRLEIIVQNDNQHVYVFDSATGAILFQAKTTFPPGWTARSFNGPEVSILVQGGAVHLIVANSAATVTSYRFDPTASTSTRFSFVKEWERRLTDCYSNPGMDSKPVLADLDRDGRFEIVAATEESGVYALRSDGRVLWKNCIAGGNAEPGIGDLNQDNYPDVVFGSDGGTVTAMEGRTGSVLWSFHVPSRFNVGAGSMPVGPAVAQLDGVGGPDVVVGVRDSHDADVMTNNHALLLALDHAGRLLWGKQDPLGNPLTYTHPIVVDADKDGAAEVYWGDWNTVGHKPPFDESKAWARTGPANFYRFSATGAQVWKQSLDTFWSNKDVALADVDGDGVQEVLANGPGEGHDGVWYLDSRTGAKEAFVDAYPYQLQRGPIVADLAGNGKMQWVAPVAPLGSVGAHGIVVYDTGQAFDAAWPHLPYPALQPALPPPPPPSTFNATFTIKAPNAWWQEVFVSPNPPRTISKVEVRIAGTFWRPMSKSSWGAWTSSYNTPAGTKVEFLATDANGAVSQSAPFTWLDGNLTKPSVAPGAPPPPPPFDATFNLTEGVNEWWVEVRVAAPDPVTAVDVQVNGGAWTPLSATSWGTWAKSFYVAQGSLVRFRATASFGAQDTSDTYKWLVKEGEPFNPTFLPRAQDNNWWVEVEVRSGVPVVQVDAQVNGGSWTNLPKTSWGTWAKSFHVPDGSQVRFRATSEAGETALSASYLWG